MSYAEHQRIGSLVYLEELSMTSVLAKTALAKRAISFGLAAAVNRKVSWDVIQSTEC